MNDARRLPAGFRIFLLGQTCSLLGSEVTRITWQTVALVGLSATSLELGVLYGAFTVVDIFVPLALGPVVQRLDLLRTMRFIDLTRACILVGLSVLVLSSTLEFWSLLTAVIVLGALGSGYASLQFIILPLLVGPTLRARGNARLQSAHSLAATAGPGIGGALYTVASGAVGFLVDAASYLLSVRSLTLLRRRSRASERILTDRYSHEHTYTQQVLAGWTVLRQYPEVLWVSSCTFVFNVWAGATAAVLPVRGLTELSLNPAVFGIALGAGSGIALVTSFAIPTLSARIREVHTLWVGMAVAATGMLVFMLPTSTVTLSFCIVFFGFALVSSGAAVFMVANNTIRHNLIAEQDLPIIFGTTRIFVRGALPIGGLVGGLVATSGSAGAVFLGAGIVDGCTALVLGLGLMRLTRRSDMKG